MEYDLTKADRANIKAALKALEGHNSYGTYIMSCLYVKGGKRVLGLNTLRRPAKTLFADVSGEWLGQHCEMHVAHQTEIKGGTAYIVGRSFKTRKLLANSKPCMECRPIISGARKIVYFLNGIPTVEFI